MKLTKKAPQAPIPIKRAYGTLIINILQIIFKSLTGKSSKHPAPALH
jgi:hypothetical protein